MPLLEITMQSAWLPISVTALVINALIIYLVVKMALSDVLSKHNRELLEQTKLQNQLKIYELIRQGASADEVQEQVDIAFRRKGQTTLVAQE